MMTETAARLLVNARSAGACEVCGRPADSIHHRNKQGRVWTPENLLALCGDGTRYCHGWIEAHPTDAMLLGLWVPRSIDPATVPAYVKPAQFLRAWWTLDSLGCFTFVDTTPPPDHPDTPARLRAIRSLTLARSLPISSLIP